MAITGLCGGAVDQRAGRLAYPVGVEQKSCFEDFSPRGRVCQNVIDEPQAKNLLFVMCQKNRCFARAQHDIQVICSIATRSRVRCRICLINFAMSSCCRETAERLTQTARSRRQSATRSQRPGRPAQGPWHNSCKNKFLAGGCRMDALDLTLNRKENSLWRDTAQRHLRRLRRRCMSENEEL